MPSYFYIRRPKKSLSFVGRCPLVPCQTGRGIQQKGQASTVESDAYRRTGGRAQQSGHQLASDRKLWVAPRNKVEVTFLKEDGFTALV